jgi:hypothetical protein
MLDRARFRGGGKSSSDVGAGRDFAVRLGVVSVERDDVEDTGVLDGDEESRLGEEESTIAMGWGNYVAVDVEREREGRDLV